MSKQFEPYETWLASVRENAPHFKHRDLMCDVPWPHLAKLLHERDVFMRGVIDLDDKRERAINVLNGRSEAAQERHVDEPRGGTPHPLVGGKEVHESNRQSTQVEAHSTRDHSESEVTEAPTSDETQAGEWEELTEGVTAYANPMDLRAGDGASPSLLPGEQVVQTGREDHEPRPEAGEYETSSPPFVTPQTPVEAQIEESIKEGTLIYNTDFIMLTPEAFIRDARDRGVSTPWKDYQAEDFNQPSETSDCPLSTPKDRKE